MLDLLLTLWFVSPFPVPQKAPPVLTESLVRVATALDLSTPAEDWGKAPFASDFGWTRMMLGRMGDAPPSHDALRFPPASECDHALNANYAYRTHVEARQAFMAGEWFAHETVLAECCRLAEIWSTARQAQSPTNIAARREGLKRLRELIGETDFYAGRLPAPVPLRHFLQID